MCCLARRLFRPAQAAAAALAAAVVSGCAHVHVDAQGQTQVLGLVWLTLPPPAAEGHGATAGQGLRMRALGLSWLRTEVGASLVLGWQDSSLAYLLDHKLVDARAALQRTPYGMSFTSSPRSTTAQSNAPTGELE